MGWHSIDAIEGAFQRTKHTLFEPFDFWKWIKLGIIIFLIGSVGGSYNSSNSNSNGSTFHFEDDDKEFLSDVKDEFFPFIDESFTDFRQFWHQYMIYILIMAGLIILMILLFAYISSLMEFVFVESLVTNIVAFRAYSRQFLRLGFNLFIIRLILVLIGLLLLSIVMLPIIMTFLRSPQIISPELIIGGITWSAGVFFVVIMLVIIGGFIQSFINLSIPLAMYHNIGIITAFKKVFNLFLSDWEQIVVYWIVKLILGIIVEIIVIITAFILLITVVAAAVTMGAILYYILLLLGQGIEDVLFWIVMVPFGAFVLSILIMLGLMFLVPASVFKKYFMLTFLQSWYPDARIPFND